MIFSTLLYLLFPSIRISLIIAFGCLAIWIVPVQLFLSINLQSWLNELGHFELKSKAVSIIFLIMVVGLAISIFFAIYFKNQKKELQSNNVALQRNNANLEDEAVNYYLVRAHFPEIEKIITRNIRKDKSGYIQLADEIIETRKKL
jgi:hypothetical protein